MSPGINNYGMERIMSNTDWAVFTNKQIGLLDPLTVAIANRLVALTFPSGFNIETQTITTHKIEFDQHDPQPISNNSQMLAIYLSMLSEKLTDDFVRLAAEDQEAMRAQFAGPMYFGDSGVVGSDSTAAGSVLSKRNGHPQIKANWNPEVRRVRQLTPFYVMFQNASMQAVSTIGGNMGVVDYAQNSIDATTIREWFNVVKLTRAERGFRGSQLQWLRLNS